MTDNDPSSPNSHSDPNPYCVSWVAAQIQATADPSPMPPRSSRRARGGGGVTPAPISRNTGSTGSRRPDAVRSPMTAKYSTSYGSALTQLPDKSMVNGGGSISEAAAFVFKKVKRDNREAHRRLVAAAASSQDTASQDDPFDDPFVSDPGRMDEDLPELPPENPRAGERRDSEDDVDILQYDANRMEEDNEDERDPSPLPDDTPMPDSEPEPSPEPEQEPDSVPETLPELDHGPDLEPSPEPEAEPHTQPDSQQDPSALSPGKRLLRRKRDEDDAAAAEEERERVVREAQLRKKRSEALILQANKRHATPRRMASSLEPPQNAPATARSYIEETNVYSEANVETPVPQLPQPHRPQQPEPQLPHPARPQQPEPQLPHPPRPQQPGGMTPSPTKPPNPLELGSATTLRPPGQEALRPPVSPPRPGLRPRPNAGKVDAVDDQEKAEAARRLQEQERRRQEHELREQQNQERLDQDRRDQERRDRDRRNRVREEEEREEQERRDQERLIQERRDQERRARHRQHQPGVARNWGSSLATGIESAWSSFVSFWYSLGSGIASLWISFWSTLASLWSSFWSALASLGTQLRYYDGIWTFLKYALWFLAVFSVISLFLSGGLPSLPSFRPRLTMTSDEYNALKELIGNPTVLSPGVRGQIESLLPRIIPAQRDKTGKLVIEDDVWHAVKDKILKDKDVTENLGGEPSGPKWKALLEQVKASAGTFEDWLKSKKNKKMLSEAIREELPAVIIDNLPSHISHADITREVEKHLARERSAVQRQMEKMQESLHSLAEEAAKIKPSPHSTPRGMTKEEVAKLVDAHVQKAIANARLETATKSKVASRIDEELHGRVNHFAFGNGVQVDISLSSPTWILPDPPAKRWWPEWPSWIPWKKDAKLAQARPQFIREKWAALTPWSDAGDCWCAGILGADMVTRSPADIGILLGQLVIPEYIVVEHINPAATVDPLSMPKDFEVWAIVGGPHADEVRNWAVASFPATYADENINADARVAQTIRNGFVKIGEFRYTWLHREGGVQAHRLSRELVESLRAETDQLLIRAKTNAGADHTCFYRLRMYGEIVELVGSGLG